MSTCKKNVELTTPREGQYAQLFEVFNCLSHSVLVTFVERIDVACHSIVRVGQHCWAFAWSIACLCDLTASRCAIIKAHNAEGQAGKEVCLSFVMDDAKAQESVDKVTRQHRWDAETP